MTANPPPTRTSRLLLITVLATLAGTAGGCFLIKQPAEDPVATAPAREQSSEQAAEIQTLRQDLARTEDSRQSLRDDSRRLEMQVLEKESQLVEMKELLQSQQRILDEAIHEVVRAKAKQRSLESRAEAASEMAEAEIALRNLQAQEGAAESDGVVHATQLLASATEEFRKENFGGALYLTSQAKGQIRLGRMRQGQVETRDVVAGESLFAAPLTLRLTSRTNFREGPGTEYKILSILEPEAEVTGVSSKGEWIRVMTAGGESGWVHQSLIAHGGAEPVGSSPGL